MKKLKLLSLLVALVCAASVWATDYYVVGNMTDWQTVSSYKMSENPASPGEYMWVGAFSAYDQFKVATTSDGTWPDTWFPDNAPNYGENGEISANGIYTVYFRPDYSGNGDWYYSCIYVAAGAPAQADQNITANQDPQHAGVYYSTFYDSSVKYLLPAGVEAYIATVSGDDLLMTKIAVAGQTLPADNAVILKSTVNPFTLAVSDATPVSFSVANSLQGTDVAVTAPANCYVLSGKNGVGFYQYSAMLTPHKAYVIFGGSLAPQRMRFIFAEEQTATGVENASADNDGSQKRMENGRLVVIKNGVRYNAQGQIVK